MRTLKWQFNSIQFNPMIYSDVLVAEVLKFTKQIFLYHSPSLIWDILAYVALIRIYDGIHYCKINEILFFINHSIDDKFSS